MRPLALLTFAGLLSFFLIGASQATFGPNLVLLPGFFPNDNVITTLPGQMFFGGSIVTMSLFGFLLHDTSPRFQGVSSSVSLVLGAGLMGASPSWSIYCAGAALLGCGYGGLNMLYNALFSRSYGARTPQMMSLINGFWGIGSVVGPQLVRDHRLATFAPLVIAGVVTAVLAAFVPSVPENHTSDKHPILPLKVTIAFTALFTCYVAFETSTVALASQHTVHAFGWATSRGALIGSLFWAGLTAGRFAASAIRGIAPKFWVYGCGLSAVCAVAMTVSPSTAMVGYGLMGVCCGPFFPNGLSWLRYNLRASTRSLAFVVVGASTGATIGPALTNSIAPNPGAIPVINIALGVVFLIAIVAASTLSRPYSDKLGAHVADTADHGTQA